MIENLSLALAGEGIDAEMDIADEDDLDRAVRLLRMCAGVDDTPGAVQDRLAAIEERLDSLDQQQSQNWNGNEALADLIGEVRDQLDDLQSRLDALEESSEGSADTSPEEEPQEVEEEEEEDDEEDEAEVLKEKIRGRMGSNAEDDDVDQAPKTESSEHDDVDDPASETDASDDAEANADQSAAVRQFDDADGLRKEPEDVQEKIVLQAVGDDEVSVKDVASQLFDRDVSSGTSEYQLAYNILVRLTKKDKLERERDGRRVLYSAPASESGDTGKATT